MPRPLYSSSSGWLPSPHRLTVRAATRLLDRGLVTSEQLVSFCHSLAVAGEEIWGLNAYGDLSSRDNVIDAARESDRRRYHGETVSIFDGIPISIKANLAVKTHPLTAGSLVLGFGYNLGDSHNNTSPPPPTPPCGYDADVVRILLREKGGSILMGMTSMDEFGMGSLGTNSRLPDGSPRPTKNPIPYLPYLTWDDDDVHDTASGTERNIDEQRLATILGLPHEAILERHYVAYELATSRQQSTNDILYSAGGSSCGSAVSVAHGSALLSLGTDTGGSVRLPAAWCGIVGFKPSYGLLSRHGVVSYASSFDTVGLLGTSIDCVASALDMLAQRENTSRDSTFSSYRDASPSTNVDVDGGGGSSGDDSNWDMSSELSIAQILDSSDPEIKALSGLRVGIPSSFSVEECPPNILDAWSRTAECLQRHGADIVELSTNAIAPELVRTALAAYYVLVSAEASSNLSRYDGFRYGVTATLGNDDGNESRMLDLTPLERQYAATRRIGFGTEVARRILCGTSVLSSDRFHTYYEAAAKLRAQLANDMMKVLDNDVDVLLIPTALSLPPPIITTKVGRTPGVEEDDSYNNNNNTAMFANDVMTVPASLAGLPAISIPIPLHIGNDNNNDINNSPFVVAGMQLIGPRLKEGLLLKVGKVLECAAEI